MLVPKKLCSVCDLIKGGDKRLLERLYHSKYYLKSNGAETLSTIQRSYKDKFSLNSIKNHCRKHQFIDAVAYNKAQLKKVDERAQNKAVERIITAQDTLQSILIKGNQNLDDGVIDVNTNHLLRASQIKIASEEKQKDQELKFMEMLAFFSSGNAKLEPNKTDSQPQPVIDVDPN